MIFRSSFAALLTGSFVIFCSWSLSAQPAKTSAEPSTQSSADQNPIERLPDAPEPMPWPMEAAPATSATPDPTLAPTAPSAATPNINPPDVSKPDTTSLRSIVQRLKLPLPLPQPHIVVLKSQRLLNLYSADTLVKSYRVALGKNPYGHKQRQGDGRTPEGQFYICTRNAQTSAFHIFLGLSYPALPDAKRAVNEKAISWREYEAIRGRLASRGTPLWETRLGGWVGIHGGSESNFAHKRALQRGRPDWTAGCIAVTNREIDEIYTATRLGTPVLVKP